MKNSKFLGYLHSFRGFAILCIVLVHSGVMPIFAYYDFGEIDESDTLFVFNESLFHASTIYFAIISGLLFTAFLKKKGFKRFFKNKFLYVFLPYLFFTLLLSIGKTPETPTGDAGIHTSLIDYLSTMINNLVYGKAIPIFWYMPVLFCLYFLTPFLDWIIERKDLLKWLVLPLVLAPIIISRQPMALGYEFYWEDVVFFVGVYCVGMLIGKYLEISMQWMENNFKLLSALALITLLGIIIVNYNQVEQIGITSIPESLHYLNKLFITAIMLVVFKRLEKQPKFFTALANDAFAIYFIHFLAIFLMLLVLNPIISNKSWYPWSAFLTIPTIAIMSLLISKGLIWLLKKIFGKYSKMIIGS